MPLVQTRGAASAQGFGEFAQATAVNYIEDVFSTFLYTGNGSTQTITNGIDLSTKGGMVWTKNRNATQGNAVFDTVRGNTKYLLTQTTDGNQTSTDDITGFLSTGYTLGNSSTTGNTNYGTYTYVSWTFREQPKFFDIVTWTGTGVARNITHNLGSVPGCIIVKCTSDAEGWFVYHRTQSNTKNAYLNYDSAYQVNYTPSVWNDTTPTSSVFTLGTRNEVNGTGKTFVAYLFAHDAGGFGLTGTDNVISCGSYSGTGATGNAITLGYEPQWVMVKRTDSTADWVIMDAMRSGFLEPNTSDAESGGVWFALSGDNFFPTATGFQINTAGPAWNASGGSYIYIAIRRGPMKVPTVGTSVFSPVARTGTGVQTNVGGLSFSPDLLLVKNRGNTQLNWAFDRLRGGNEPLSSNSSDDEATNTATYFGGSTVFTPNNTGFGISSAAQVNTTSGSYANWLFGRAPGFFDEVCYTGNGTAGQTYTHNLGVVPELMIVKSRNQAVNWRVYIASAGPTKYLNLNLTDSIQTASIIWNNTAPTASVFSVGANLSVNGSGSTYVAYLFATLADVSKVGSYTGNAGYTVTVPCGFTAGVRFVLIKRTDSTGDWYVWDSARGIVAGNDPYLLLNDTAAEVTGTDYVDTYAAGFEVTSTAPAGLNATGGTYIFLAIA